MGTHGAPVIAIDGPAASGKSTVALELAMRLELMLVDSGSMYRAVTLLALERGVGLDDHDCLSRLAREVSDSFSLEICEGSTPRIQLGGREVTREIRFPEVGEAVSPVSAVHGVRDEIMRLQRSMVAGGGAVVEGRDIGTAVFPDALLKVFLEASAAERARRRYLELQAKGMPVTEAEVMEEIAMRDSIDSSREYSPLAMATDALLIDTTDKEVEQVVEEIVSALGERGLL
jgi:cytidylate kinase